VTAFFPHFRGRRFGGGARAIPGCTVVLYKTLHRSGKMGVNHFCCTNTTLY